MSARIWIWAVPLLAIGGLGCSKADVPVSPPKQTAPSAALPLTPAVATAVLPAPAPAVPPPKDAGPPGFIPPFPENIDMFAPPKAPPPPLKPEPEKPAEPAPVAPPVAAPEKKIRPPLRLVGFVSVASPKALLSLDGKLNALQTGDLFQDVEVVAIEPPSVTLKFDDEQYTLNLLQPPAEGTRTNMRTLPMHPAATQPRGAVIGRSPAATIPSPAVNPPNTPTPPPAPMPAVAGAAEQPPSAPPLPSLEAVAPAPPPALPGVPTVNSLRDLPKVP